MEKAFDYRIRHNEEMLECLKFLAAGKAQTEKETLSDIIGGMFPVNAEMLRVLRNNMLYIKYREANDLKITEYTASIIYEDLSGVEY